MRTVLRRAGRCLALGTIAVSCVSALFVAGCTEKPDAPVWDNPLDPSAAGDPFDLRAVMGHNIVRLTWNALERPHVSEFVVYRSLDSLAYDSVGVVFSPATSYVDERFAPDRLNYYKLAARDAAGHVSAISRVAAARILTAPWLEIADGAQTVATRHVRLAVHARTGDTLELAADPAFTDSVEVPAEGDTLSLSWDLGAADSNGVYKRVWARMRNGPAFSPVAHDSVRTAFHPGLGLEGAPASVATRLETVHATDGLGITGLRFAVARDSLALKPFVSPDSIATDGIAWFTGEVLSPDPAPQWLYGEFTSDFGYSVIESLRCVPDPLTSAYFTLAGGDSLTSDTVVPLVSHAVATEMRFSESPDLSAVPWEAYQDSVGFALSPGAGLKTVYGQYRNDWADALVMDTIIFVQTGSRIVAGSRIQTGSRASR